MITKGTWYSMEDTGHPPWTWIVTLSLLLHGMVVLGILGMEHYNASRGKRPTVISVSLVGPPSEAKHALPRPSPRTENQPTKSPKVKIRRPIPKAERKLVSIRPAEMKAPTRETKRPKPTAKRSTAPKTARLDTPREATPPATMATTQPSGGGGGQLTAEQYEYGLIVRERIQENWRAYLSPDHEFSGEVRIIITPDGRILELTFLKGSGKAHVDESIVRAIKKTILPPPPRSLANQPWVLRFWASGP